MKSTIEILSRPFAVHDLGEGINLIGGRLGQNAFELLIVTKGEHARIECTVHYCGGKLSKTVTDRPGLRIAITWVEETIKELNEESLGIGFLSAIAKGMSALSEAEREELKALSKKAVPEWKN